MHASVSTVYMHNSYKYVYFSTELVPNQPSARSSRLKVLDVFERKNDQKMLLKEKELVLREKEAAAGRGEA